MPLFSSKFKNQNRNADTFRAGVAMPKFEPGKAYYFTPCECIGRERRDRRLIAVASENDDGRVAFVLVGSLLEGFVEEMDGTETVKIRNGDFTYFASAATPANVGDLTGVLKAIKNNREAMI